VTHDQEEAFEVADRVVVMHHGQVQQMGTPQELFERPENEFVMEFLGEVNVFRGFVERGRAKLGALEVSYPQHPHDEPRAATAFVRAHELDILAAPDARPSLHAKVLLVNSAGPVIKLRVAALDFGVELSVNLDRERPGEVPKVGDIVWVAPRRVRVFVQDYAI
jgi:sulfate transport system ATP-binding protein